VYESDLPLEWQRAYVARWRVYKTASEDLGMWDSHRSALAFMHMYILFLRRTRTCVTGPSFATNAYKAPSFAVRST